MKRGETFYLGEEILSTPAIVDSDLIVRANQRLHLFEG